MKLFKDIKKELHELLEEKEANREMKLMKSVADKKILSFTIITIFILVTIFSNFLCNSFDSAVNLLEGGENQGILFNLLIPNLSYPIVYILVYIVVGILLSKWIWNIKASFRDIKEGQKGTSRFTTLNEIKEQYKCINEIEDRVELENGGYEGKGGVIISRHMH